MTRPGRYVPLTVILLLVALAVAFGPSLVERLAYAAEKGSNTAAREDLAKLSQREQLSKLFRAVAKAVKPAVVEVRVKKRVKMPSLFGPEDFFRRFRGDSTPQQGEPPRERYFMRRGLGSGVIIDAGNGYVLTNHHVVGGADEVEIVLGDGRKYDAEWVRSDWQTDLAVVKVKADRLIAAPLGDSDDMEVGDWVLAIGAPEALPQTVTAGIISAKGRKTGGRPFEDFLQTDAAINHGNSGGPLVNMRGEVVGISAAIVSRTGVNEGIGLAIPANMAKKVMRQLIDTGAVVRGYLGVKFQPIEDEALAKSFKLPGTEGVLVTEVLEGGPAAEAGVEVEDFIVAVNDKAVTDGEDLRNFVAEAKPGSKVKLTVYRDGKKTTLTVTVGKQPEDMYAALKPQPPEERPKRYGLELRTLTKELAQQYGYDEKTKGVLVTEVEPDSNAAEGGLQAGMVIERVNGRDVTTAEEFAKALSAAKEGAGVRLRVLRPDGYRRYVIVRPK